MGLKIYNSDAQEQYIGQVIRTQEHNGYHDSDWSALVWDNETNSAKWIKYHTTRGASTGWAHIDATEAVLARYNAVLEIKKEWGAKTAELERSLKVSKGSTVKIVRGVKGKGAEGVIIWVGRGRVGVALDSTKNSKGLHANVAWINTEYVKSVNADRIEAEIEALDNDYYNRLKRVK